MRSPTLNDSEEQTLFSSWCGRVWMQTSLHDVLRLTDSFLVEAGLARHCLLFVVDVETPESGILYGPRDAKDPRTVTLVPLIHAAMVRREPVSADDLDEFYFTETFTASLSGTEETVIFPLCNVNHELFAELIVRRDIQSNSTQTNLFDAVLEALIPICSICISQLKIEKNLNGQCRTEAERVLDYRQEALTYLRNGFSEQGELLLRPATSVRYSLWFVLLTILIAILTMCFISIPETIKGETFFPDSKARGLPLPNQVIVLIPRNDSINFKIGMKLNARLSCQVQSFPILITSFSNSSNAIDPVAHQTSIKTNDPDKPSKDNVLISGQITQQGSLAIAAGCNAERFSSNTIYMSLPPSSLFSKILVLLKVELDPMADHTDKAAAHMTREK